jgi:hypothetical protein
MLPASDTRLSPRLVGAILCRCWVEIDDSGTGSGEKLLRSSKELFRLLASLIKSALLKIDRGKAVLVVVQRKYFIDFMFEPTWFAPQVFRLLFIPPRNSSTIHISP